MAKYPDLMNELLEQHKQSKLMEQSEAQSRRDVAEGTKSAGIMNTMINTPTKYQILAKSAPQDNYKQLLNAYTGGSQANVDNSEMMRKGGQDRFKNALDTYYKMKVLDVADRKNEPKPKGVKPIDLYKVQEKASEFAGLKSDIDAVKKLIEPYGDKDIPGVGTLGGILPSNWQSTEAQLIRQKMEDLSYKRIKAEQGNRISDADARIMAKRQALDWTGSKEKFLAALENTSVSSGNLMKSKMSGFEPDVVNRYRELGGNSPGIFGDEYELPYLKTAKPEVQQTTEPAKPVATKRYNPETGQLEVI